MRFAIYSNWPQNEKRGRGKIIGKNKICATITVLGKLKQEFWK